MLCQWIGVKKGVFYPQIWPKPFLFVLRLFLLLRLLQELHQHLIGHLDLWLLPLLSAEVFSQKELSLFLSLGWH